MLAKSTPVVTAVDRKQKYPRTKKIIPTTANAPVLLSFNMSCLCSSGRRDIIASQQSIKPSMCMKPQSANGRKVIKNATTKNGKPAYTSPKYAALQIIPITSPISGRNPSIRLV